MPPPGLFAFALHFLLCVLRLGPHKKIILRLKHVKRNYDFVHFVVCIKNSECLERKSDKGDTRCGLISLEKRVGRLVDLVSVGRRKRIRAYQGRYNTNPFY